MDPKMKKNISCPVCTEIYKKPVILNCSHSFCKECLQQFWEGKGSRECPVCRKQSKEFPLPNLALQNLCEAFSETSLQDRERTHGLCEEHNCKLVFSRDDKPVCPECRDSKLLQHHNPSEVAASQLKTTTDQQDDLSALLTDSGEPNLEQAIARAKEIVDRLDNVILNIAVTGESGAGKSSFVNAIRGLTDTDEGAARVDEVECTMEPTAYPHPTMPNVKIWDLPGTGTPAFNTCSYTKTVKFQTYDFFIIVSASRFRENDIILAEEIKQKKKKFYFVRSKIDIDVANAERRKMKEEETLRQIRDHCVENLSKLGPPPVFLITSHDLNRFDFPKLIDTLDRDLPENEIKPDRARKTGASMSSSMNAIRDLRLAPNYTIINDSHQRSASVRKIQTTMKPKRYSNPKKPKIKFWDLPGIGTTAFNASPENKTEIDRAKEIVDRLDNVILNIAVTGESGAGKSSFVNAIRGLTGTDEGAARVDEEECTMEPTLYPHPTMPNVNIWDLPGLGTRTFNASSYTKRMDFETYDFFIIVSATRFKENDIRLAKEITKMKKRFYFVRSKLDIDVANAERRGMTEEKTLKNIRDHCLENLSLLGRPPVFLITSHDLNRFDFPELIDTLERDLPENKRDALVLGLPVYSQQSLEKKYKKLKKSVWALAVLSCGIGAAPVPGLSTACDAAIVVSFLTACYHSFGLDDKSLIKLGERVNKPILAMVKESKLIQALATNTLLSSDLITKILLAGAVETACIFVPIAGNIIAAGVSFATTRSVLSKGLEELYNAAKLVVKMAELK